MKIDKSKFKDEKGRFLVQGLFLEDRYNADMSVFTFEDQDKLYKGKTFISLKKQYIEAGDPTEYIFANECLYNWEHWQRMCRNKVISTHIDKWRDELHLSLVADGVISLMELAREGKHYQAAKWLADGGFKKDERGRPSKEKIEGELKKRADEHQEWSEDFQLLQLHNKGRK